MKSAIEDLKDPNDHSQNPRPSGLKKYKSEKNKKNDDNNKAKEHENLLIDLQNRKKWQPVVKFPCQIPKLIREMTYYFFHAHEHLENDQPDK